MRRRIAGRGADALALAKIADASGIETRLQLLDEAESVLDGVKLADQDNDYEQLRAQIDIKREAAKSPEDKA